jgi:hypothetical protein
MKIACEQEARPMGRPNLSEAWQLVRVFYRIAAADQRAELRATAEKFAAQATDPDRFSPYLEQARKTGNI